MASEPKKEHIKKEHQDILADAAKLEETVVAIPTSYFNTVIGVPSNGIITISPLSYVYKLFNFDMIKLIDRQTADQDESYKQIIPYAVLISLDKDTGFPIVFTYKRHKSGGEKRLHDLLSLGVGGHMTAEDYHQYLASQQGTNIRLVPYMESMLREIAEEVTFDDPDFVHWPAGIIYDDSTPVGRVHVGILHILRVHDHEVIKSLSPELHDGEWRKMWLLNKDIDSYEGWSKIVINAFRNNQVTF